MKNLPVEIPLSKSKLIKLMIASVIFVALGFWMIFTVPGDGPGIFRNPVVVKGVGAASILFFGLCFIVMLTKIGSKKPGLIITDDGILDNSSGVSAGQIPWTDIAAIKLTKVVNQRFLMLIVRNPEDYIQRQKNVLRRKAMEMNYRTYGSPISISANALQCRLDELKTILEERLTAINGK